MSAIVHILEHIGYVAKMSVSGYRDRWLEPWLHQYVVSMSKTLNPHCFSRLNCEMSTRLAHPRVSCLFCAISALKEIALKNPHIY